MTSPQADRHLGLRERKKARTRDAIQTHALRLFDSKGYAETTVEEIAEASEVSPSTFFRYFPTKEDTVMYDRLDPILIEAFLAQPAELTPLQAFRAAIHETLDTLPAEESELESVRHRLFYRVPALRTRLIDRAVDTMDLMTEAVARRVGADQHDLRVRTFTGAVFGALLTTMYGGGESAMSEPPKVTAELIAAVDRCLAILEDGIPFEHGES